MNGELILQCPFCSQKDAEIERLKESAKYDSFLREKYRALITKLCDALEKKRREIYDGTAWVNTLSEEDEKFIQQGREATR